MMIVNLVETTCLSRYPRPPEITYDRGSEFLDHKFKNNLIEEKCGILYEPGTSWNSQANYVSKRINQVTTNLIRTFELGKYHVDKDDPRKGILAAEAFPVCSKISHNQKKSPSQLVFGRDMVVPIEHVSNWRLIKQLKQKLIEKTPTEKIVHTHIINSEWTINY